jgi:Protein of unknown function (DUF1761)
VSILPTVIAGLAYFALGGLWFTPLFGRQWDRAVGFDRPPKWRPPAPYYVGPLLGCLLAAAATSALHGLVQPTSVSQAAQLGLIVGFGYGATITSVNAISPNVPRPSLYAAVVGSYHLVGLTVCSTVLHGLAGYV